MGQTLIAMDADALSTIAGIISAFGVSMLVFRIQRELHMQELNERNWIPLSDWLLVSATIISLLFVLIPLPTSIGSSDTSLYTN